MSKLFSLFANLRWPSRKESSLAQQKPTPMRSLSSLLLTAACQNRKVIGELKTAIEDAQTPSPTQGMDVVYAHSLLIQLLDQATFDCKLALLSWVLRHLKEEMGQSQAEPRKGRSEVKPWQHEG